MGYLLTHAASSRLVRLGCWEIHASVFQVAKKFLGVDLCSLAIVTLRMSQLDIALFVPATVAKRNNVIDVMISQGDLVATQGA